MPPPSALPPDGEHDQILVRGAMIAGEDVRRPEAADVLIENGIIVRVAQGIEPPAGARIREIDGRGRVLLPALFDAHVHFREPGREDKETVLSGSLAAINGGITGVVMMPDTSPAIDGGGMVQAVMDNARENSPIGILVAGCITKGREGRDLAAIASMKARGAVMITDADQSVANPLVLRRAMEYARNFDLVIACHCEIPELSADGAMNEGPRSYGLGVPGIPSCSEEIGIDRDLSLARYTGARVHIQHVSTALGLATIRRFKEAGVPVTCEVTPHHLLLHEGDMIDYDTAWKTNPPLRTPEDNAALVEGLIDGTIDIIATDHSPHTEFETNQDFGSAPFGIVGLETALPALHHHLVRDGAVGWDVVVRRFSAEPRRLLGMEPAVIREGARAELILFNPARTTRVTRDFLRSKSANTPFLDREMEGSVELVILDDRILLER